MDKQEKQLTTEEKLRKMVKIEAHRDHQRTADRFVDLLINLITKRSEDIMATHIRIYDHRR